jgi:hypothetical protein
VDVAIEAEGVKTSEVVEVAIILTAEITTVIMISKKQG